VYGTDLPAYHVDSQLTPSGDGQTLHFKLTESGVSPDFRMLVPMYLELEDGKAMRLGSATLIGNSSVEKTIQLPKLSSPVKKFSINYNYDVLCTDN